MKKKTLIGVSICAVVLLVMASLTNVVGSESIQTCGCGDPPCWPELSGEMGCNNWYVSKVIVTFNGTVDGLLYRINGSNWINYNEPFTMKTEGIHLLEWTCDSNMSNISSLEIKIDYNPPRELNYTTERIGLLKWRISMTAIDDISGVDAVEFYIANIIDTEPPFEVIWRGCLWLNNLLDTIIIIILFGIWGPPFDVWDNAGNHIPHYSVGHYNNC